MTPLTTLTIFILTWILIGQTAYQIIRYLDGPANSVKECIYLRFLFSALSPVAFGFCIIALLELLRDKKPHKWL